MHRPGAGHRLRSAIALLPLLPLLTLYGALALDVAGRAGHRPGLWTAGARVAVAGVVAGLVSVAMSAVHHRRLTWGMCVTLIGLGLVALARWLRGDAAVQPEPILLGMAALGAVAVTLGTWLSRRAVPDYLAERD